MQPESFTVVVLGTGGTIAGTAGDPADDVGYSAAQIGVAQLVAAIPALRRMRSGGRAGRAGRQQGHGARASGVRWRSRVERHLARPEVLGIVVTHGTDTLEETAYFLRVRGTRQAGGAGRGDAARDLASRPTGREPADAFTVASRARRARRRARDGRSGARRARRAQGSSASARCVHSGDAGALARIEEGRVRMPARLACGTGTRHRHRCPSGAAGRGSRS